MKRSLLISGVLATVVTVFGLSGVSSSKLDLPGLNQRIDKIDARITKNQADVVKLQESTQTAPADHVVVPVVQSTPARTAAPASTPVPAPAAPQPSRRTSSGHSRSRADPLYRSGDIARTRNEHYGKSRDAGNEQGLTIRNPSN